MSYISISSVYVSFLRWQFITLIHSYLKKFWISSERSKKIILMISLPQLLSGDISFLQNTIINIVINHICCSHSDANGVCQRCYCVSDKLGTLFACKENACLPQNSTQQRVTQRICLSDWLVSCLNAHQSLDFYEPFLKESTPHSATVWSFKVAMLTSTTATFQEGVCGRKIDYYFLYGLWRDTQNMSVYHHLCDLQDRWMSPLPTQSKIYDPYQ